MQVREQVNLSMESARQEGTVSNPLEARVELAAEPGIYAALMAVESDLAPIFKVSQVEVEEVFPGLAGVAAYLATPAEEPAAARPAPTTT